VQEREGKPTGFPSPRYGPSGRDVELHSLGCSSGDDRALCSKPSPNIALFSQNFGVGSGSGVPLALPLALFIALIVSAAVSGAASSDWGLAHCCFRNSVKVPGGVSCGVSSGV
jgi:hypothetical protein